jgi:general secretion pathway protein G
MNRTRVTSRLGPRGLTLVEVLAVVVILGLIAGTFMLSFSGMFGKAKHELAKSRIGIIVGKLELYRLEKDVWPGSDVGLTVLANGKAAPTDPYFLSQDQLLDPWNRPFLYVEPGPDGHPYEILTYGSDGRQGGTGDAADLSSTSLEEKRS